MKNVQYNSGKEALLDCCWESQAHATGLLDLSEWCLRDAAQIQVYSVPSHTHRHYILQWPYEHLLPKAIISSFKGKVEQSKFNRNPTSTYKLPQNQNIDSRLVQPFGVRLASPCISLLEPFLLKVEAFCVPNYQTRLMLPFPQYHMPSLYFLLVFQFNS